MRFHLKLGSRNASKDENKIFFNWTDKVYFMLDSYLEVIEVIYS